MRNYRNLKAFQLADELVLMVYTATKRFPKDELFGLTSQLRRAVVSIPSNIVEGASRDTEVEFLRFLDMAYGSASELDYQISLAYRLGYIEEKPYFPLRDKSTETAKVLNGLIRSLRKKPKDKGL
ncbi:MAG: four helix bundle protein [Planctomycetota bacterium]